MSIPVVFEYFKSMASHSASDLYLTVGFPPSVRNSNGELVALSSEKLSVEDVNETLNAMLTTRQRRDFESQYELNTALDMGEYGRYRVNVMRQRQMPAVVVRRIVTNIPKFETLGLPPILPELSMLKRGLVLLTGMTGSGKSTTLASMVDYRNEREQGHIVTIEDPIEFYHDHKKSVISQREVGVDTESYQIALKNALRQRPDVILVGEIRDRDVMDQALGAAETGHLCLATLHANNAYQAIERIVNMFPEEYAAQIRLNLSLNLKAIIAQRLIPSIEGKLVPAIEVMLNQGLIRELIMKGEISRIRDVMEQNVSNGMITFDQSIIDLYRRGVISEAVALASADKSSDMKVKLKSVTFQDKKGTKMSVLETLDTSLISLKD